MPTPSLYARDIARPQRHIVIRRAPRSFRSEAPERWFADFGRAAFATVQVKGHAARPATLALRLGETLGDGGRIDRSPPGCVRYREILLSVSAGAVDRQVEIPADERNTGPCAARMPDYLFEVLPFRYAELEVLQGDFVPQEMQQLAVQYPFREDAAFSCSDERLNRVWELCRYSIIATSFAPVYVDGDRERIAYEGDAYINQLGHYCLDNDYELARRTIEYLLFHPTWPTEWQLHCVPMAWQDYLYSGDATLLQTYYDELKHKMLLPLARADGLISTCGEMPAGLLDAIHLPEPVRDLVDWPPGSFTQGGTGERDGHEMLPINTVVNAFHYWNLVLFANIAQVVGRQADAQFCATRARLVADSLQRLFSTKQGAFLDGEGGSHCSQHSSLFCAAVGLVQPQQTESVASFLTRRGMACSVYGAQHLLEALYRLGRPQQALELMRAEHDRGWLNMLRFGSTITTEAWDWKYKNNQDWNHAWGAAPANIIPRWLAGVQPAAPGFAAISVAPAPADLNWFRSRVPLKTGLLELEYSAGDGFRLDLRAESTASAKIHLDLSGIPGNCGEVILHGVPEEQVIHPAQSDNNRKIRIRSHG